MSLIKILNNWKSQISFFSVDSAFLDQPHPRNPVLYIPQWNFLDQHHLSLTLFDFGLIITGRDNKISIYTNSGILEYTDITFLHLMTQLESWFSETDLPEDFFYGMFLSYDMGLDFENVKRGRDIYDTPDFIIWFPGNGFLTKKSPGKILRITHNSPLDLKFINRNNNNKLSTINEFLFKPDQYEKKISSIRRNIKDGEYYQLNFTMPYIIQSQKSAWQIFYNLYQLNPAPFSVFGEFGDFAILSNSPERFLSINGNRIFTQPIKGTVKRGRSLEEDEKLKKWLLHSEKNAAELSMIVDLLRNDISLFCHPGSVQVERHKELQSFENVHHLVSTVSGIMNENNDLSTILRSTFPGGSITGCPKIAAMKAITELEGVNRSFYTGSFLLHFPHTNQLDSNILIRTGLKIHDHISFPVGGGIVYDSAADEEYAECVAKAASFMKVRL